MKKELWSWAKAIVIAFVLAVLSRQFIYTPTTVYGESMSPTFHKGDVVIVRKLNGIHRSDIIVFDAPDSELDERYIKRVIGVPGDSIEVKDDLLYINGELVEEPYLQENKRKASLGYFTENFTLHDYTGKSKVPEGYLFVMGDNRLISKDSRLLGFIDEDKVIGQVVFRVYPFNDIGIPE